MTRSEETLHLKNLATRIGARDSQAEAELAEILAPRLLTLMRVRTRDTDLARDLAQEAWIALMLTLRRGAATEIQDVGAFAWGVARNVANNRFRSNARSRETESLPEEVSAPQALEWETNARARLVQRVLGAIDAVDRKILNAFFVEGRESDDIGREVGLSAAAVRQRKVRVLKRLAETPELVSQVDRKGTTRS